MSQYDRTCGSVRSSLATLAGLVTARSEAVATTELRPQGRQVRREAGACEPLMSGGSSPRLMVVCPTQVNCVEAPLTPRSPVTLTGSGQNWHAVGCPIDALGHTDQSTAGVVQGLHHHISLRNLDEVNPSLRPAGAGVLARAAVGVPGRGCWKKRMPFCNGTDRSTTPPRERADFQLVVHHQELAEPTKEETANEQG